MPPPAIIHHQPKYIHHQSKYIHHHPQPSTTNQSISTTTHHHSQPSTSTHHQPKYPLPPSTTYHHPPPPTTSQNIFNHHPPPPTDSQNISTTTNHNPKYIQGRRYSIRKIFRTFPTFFIRNSFIRISRHCLTAT